MKGRLHFLIGPARSGKSTIARSWLQMLCDIENGQLIKYPGSKRPICTDPPRVVVCADDIRLALGHRYNFYAEDVVHATYYLMIRSLLEKHNVLADDTHTTKKSILNLLVIDPDAEFFYMDTPSDVCKLRAQSTGQEDLFPVIDRMFNNLKDVVKIVGMSSLVYLPDAIEEIRKEARHIKRSFERIV